MNGKKLLPGRVWDSSPARNANPKSPTSFESVGEGVGETVSSRVLVRSWKGYAYPAYE